jgi:hypothetical protein
MEAVVIGAFVISLIGWLGIPGPFVGSQPWTATPTPHVVAAAPPPAPTAPFVYTHNPAYRGCSPTNPCFANR